MASCENLILSLSKDEAHALIVYVSNLMLSLSKHDRAYSAASW